MLRCGPGMISWAVVNDLCVNLINGVNNLTQILPLEIDAHGLHKVHTEERTTAYIDVRMPWEVAQAPAGESVNIPMNQLPQNLSQLPQGVDHLIIICAHGQRSLMATQWLRENGFATAQSLMGGMASWRRFEEMAT